MSLDAAYRRITNPACERAAIMTDPAEPDNPIVFANNAFLNLTGYSRAEVLGRNPRFLQGTGSDPHTITAIRYAIRKHLAIEADILNYHKCGDPYWVRLRIRPVCDRTGRIAAFASLQWRIRAEDARFPPSIDRDAEPPLSPSTHGVPRGESPVATATTGRPSGTTGRTRLALVWSR